MTMGDGGNRNMAKKRAVTKCGLCGQTGGRFTLRGKNWIHVDCAGGSRIRDVAINPFRMSTMHISENPNAGPIEVNSLHHLRKLEKEHGVISVVANYDSNNQYVRGGKEQFRDTGER
jgi:hypothetical protein